MPIRVRLPRPLGPAILAVALLLAIGAPVATAADRNVRIVDFSFEPQKVTITVGDRVTWTNRDAIEHTATANDGSFDTGLLADGDSATFQFNAAGTYRYLCTPHPGMTGTVVVRAAGSGPPATDTIGTATTGDGGPPWALIVVALIGLAFIWPRRVARPD